jgi:hypothetical protein
MFQSALEIAESAAIPCRGRMIAHAYREICSDITNRYSPNSREDIKPLLDDLADEFEALNLSRAESGPGVSEPPIENDPGQIGVPGTLIRATGRLVVWHRREPTGRERARAIFQGLQPERRATAEIGPTADRWFKMSKFFVSCVHDRTTDDQEMMQGQFQEEVEFFEATLDSLATPAIGNLDELDNILEDANQ